MQVRHGDISVVTTDELPDIGSSPLEAPLIVMSEGGGFSHAHETDELDILPEEPRTVETVLVVEDDPDIARFVEMNLSAAGYSVAVAADGAEGLGRAQELRPDLVLLDVLMPGGIDGFEVARTLRRDPRTDDSLIIMLTCLGQTDDKVKGLTFADDYITKPFLPEELLARVRTMLRRAGEMRNQSPLTGLPGNVRIQSEIQGMIGDAKPFALLYCDLDNFKAYNDGKGFARGDRLIRATARIIEDAVAEHSRQDGFVGHVGGDDFAVVVTPDVAEEIAACVVARFDGRVAAFYNHEDVERGYVEVEDRKGLPRKLPLVSISIGVATTRTRTFGHYGAAVALATEMKQVAKRQVSSSYALDRRTL